MQDAKKICSGKECLACLGFARAFYHDLTQKRGKDEFSMYYYFDLAGPCQNAAWPDMWKIFARRLGVENALFQAFPGVTNNFLGQGNWFGYEISAATILSDLFHEAENTLKCLAKNRDEAIATFKTETGKGGGKHEVRLAFSGAIVDLVGLSSFQNTTARQRRGSTESPHFWNARGRDDPLPSYGVFP